MSNKVAYSSTRKLQSHDPQAMLSAECDTDVLLS